MCLTPLLFSLRRHWKHCILFPAHVTGMENHWFYINGPAFPPIRAFSLHFIHQLVLLAPIIPCAGNERAHCLPFGLSVVFFLPATECSFCMFVCFVRFFVCLFACSILANEPYGHPIKLSSRPDPTNCANVPRGCPLGILATAADRVFFFYKQTVPITQREKVCSSAESALQPSLASTSVPG